MGKDSELRRVLVKGFLQGIAQGVGFAMGFSVLGAALLRALRSLILSNLPGIGGFLAELISAVEECRR